MIANQEKSIGPRGNVMTPMHWGVFWFISFSFGIVAVLSSFFEVEMHVTTPGENYQCTNAALEYEDGEQIGGIQFGVDEAEYEGKELNKEWMKEHNQFQYSPTHCVPFYSVTEEPIWYGRVEDMNPWNQNLFVFGYVHIDHDKFTERSSLLLEPVEVTFHSSIRGKNMNDETWKIIQQTEEVRIMIECSLKYEVCESFQVAYIPILHYEMYDIAIEVRKEENPALDTLITQMHFQMAFINEEYTNMQLTLRIVLCTISALALILYLCKLCKTSKRFRGSLTGEMIGIAALMFALFFFNDPTYIVHVNNPNFFTYTVAEAQNAAFFCGILMFWIKDVGLQKGKILDAQGKPIEDGSNPADQSVTNNNNNTPFSNETASERRKRINKNSIVSLGITVYFFVLVIAIMILYTLYYQHVTFEPNFSLTHKHDRSIDVTTALYIVIFLLVFYYICYCIAFVQNCRYIKQTDTTQKVVFAFSQIVHLCLLITFLLGVFSRHYADGGAQIFFLCLCNWYVLAIMYLNWPVQMLSQEFAVEMRGGRPSKVNLDDSQKIPPKEIEIDKADPQQVEIEI